MKEMKRRWILTGTESVGSDIDGKEKGSRLVQESIHDDGWTQALVV